MNWKKMTANVVVLIVVIVVAILAYDSVAVMNGGTEASISSLIITLSYRQPLVPALVGWFIGLLMGHLFWRMLPNKDTEKIDKLGTK